MSKQNTEDPRILKSEKAKQRFEELKAGGLIIYEVITGSHSYGLNIETSDVDRSFIYVETLENILTGTASIQLELTKDYIGYEVGRYIELLGKNNPNTIEKIFLDDKFVEYCHPLFKKYVIDNRDQFLSSNIAFSFGSYAKTQINKAQGTNKKFMNPMDGPRKSLLDFCWVGEKQGSISLKEWMTRYSFNNFNIHDYSHIPEWFFGCVAIDHMKNCYHLFCDTIGVHNFVYCDDEMLKDHMYAHRKYNGIQDKDGVNIKLSLTEKNIIPICIFYCNIEGFQKYCEDYREYHKWLANRNIDRFIENQSADKQMDVKNTMHCHRLLDMCIEILSGEGVNVLRPNREELLDIRLGKKTYVDMLELANQKMEKIKELQKTTSLPQSVDKNLLNEILLDFRKHFYGLL